MAGSITLNTLNTLFRVFGLFNVTSKIRILFVSLLLAFAQQLNALPTNPSFHTFEDGPDPKPADDPGLWVYLGTGVALVLLGGVFAGLTIAYVSFSSHSLLD